LTESKVKDTMNVNVVENNQEKVVESIDKPIKIELPRDQQQVNVKDIKERAKNVNSLDLKENREAKETDSLKNDLKIEKLEKEIEEIKKNNLIETIKRHEEEQRQIMNEQFEILKEMKKTKEELVKDNTINKKVDDINKADVADRKKAVENIQKLAKIAIESLGGELKDVTSKKTPLNQTQPPLKIDDTKKIENTPVKSQIVENKDIQPKNIQENLDIPKTVKNIQIVESKTVKNLDKSPIPIIESKDSFVREGKRDILEVHTQSALNISSKQINASGIGRDENFL
jgi:hypothetical protein